MTFTAEISSEQFANLCSDSSKRYQIEAFSFTHQFGLNINFDDMDDLKEITRNVEFEFWALVDSISDAEIEVRAFDGLSKIIAMIEDCDSSEMELVEQYAAIVKGRYSDWDDVRKWHDDHFRTDFKGNEDFGYYLIQELGNLEIPDEIQHYFDYEAYGRDTLQESYYVINGKVYAAY